MKSYWVFFFCFHLMKINVFGVVLEKIPEEWKKYPKPVPTNYHKPLNAYVSNNKLPIIISQEKTQNAEPEINMSFSLPQNQQILSNLITPQIVTQLENTDNMIGEETPNIQIQPIVVLSKNKVDQKVFHENITFEDENEIDSKHYNEQTEVKRTEELNTNAMKNNTINDEVKTIEVINANRSVCSDDSVLNDYLKQEHKVDVDVPIKEENNKSTPYIEKLKKFKEIGPIKYIILAASKIKPNHIDKKGDESKEFERTSDIEIVINDPDTNIILCRQDNIKTAPTLKEFPNMNNENENSNIDSSSQRSVQDNRMFVTEQYTNSISNADNYANVYQIDRNMKRNRCDDIPTKYETFTTSDEGTKISNSNDQKICRSQRNTDLVIENNPRKIKLYINYRRPKNKLYFHKDYNNHNNFKLYYIRC